MMKKRRRDEGIWSRLKGGSGGERGESKVG